MVNPALATAAIGVVDPRRAGMASGINSTFRQVGIATGIAAWGAIFQHVVRDEFVRDAARAGLRGAQQRGGEVADFIAFGGARRSGNPQLARLGEQAFVAGLNHLLLLAGLLALAGAAALRRADPPGRLPPQPAPAVGVARRLRRAPDARHPRPGARRGRRRELLRRGGPRRPGRPAAHARGADRPRAPAQPLPLPARRAGAAARSVRPARCCSCRRSPRPRSASTCAAAARSPSTCCSRARRSTSSTTARSSSATARSGSSTSSTR